MRDNQNYTSKVVMNVRMIEKEIKKLSGSERIAAEWKNK
jgi:hypothetical protein